MQLILFNVFIFIIIKENIKLKEVFIIVVKGSLSLTNGKKFN